MNGAIDGLTTTKWLKKLQAPTDVWWHRVMREYVIDLLFQISTIYIIIGW